MPNGNVAAICKITSNVVKICQRHVAQNPILYNHRIGSNSTSSPHIMGLFTKDEDVPKLPPNKSKRKECWDARDKFFDCLVQNKIDDSLDPKQQQNVSSNCGALLKDFENSCVASWVKHFQDKRTNDLKRERYIAKLQAEGAQPLPFKLDRK